MPVLVIELSVGIGTLLCSACRISSSALFGRNSAPVFGRVAASFVTRQAIMLEAGSSDVEHSIA